MERYRSCLSIFHAGNKLDDLFVPAAALHIFLIILFRLLAVFQFIKVNVTQVPIGLGHLGHLGIIVV